MSEPSLTNDLFPQTSSVAGSRARTSPTPGNGRALQGAGVASGRSFGERLCHFDPATSSWRTWQLSISEGLVPFSGTWPRAGTMRNGIVCPQRPLVPRISANGFGLWPTPTVQDASNNGGPSQHQRNSLPLNAAVGGQLNPPWVEWLMGYPIGWTDLNV